MERRPSALSPPTDDAIEAIIQQATSAKQPEPRSLRDTRTQLFVGNLPYRVRWQDLKDLFRKAGTVLRADVSLGPDNRSRGYGTVLFATAEDAGRAVDMFNGYSWQTRILEVRLDRLLPEHDPSIYTPSSSTTPSSRSSPYPASGSSQTGPPSQTGPSPSSANDEPEYMSIYRGTDPNSCRNLFVGNLPFHCQWQDLKDLFRQAGTVLRADVALGPDGRSRGFGTVVFATEYDAERAVKMFNGFEYNNRVLKVHYDKFSQASQPPTTSASPAVGMSAAQMHIKLPTGFVFDYGPPSGPSTPHEMYSSMQRQQHAQVLHQPQAHHYQEHPLQMQQRQQQLLHSPYSAQSSKLDVDSLTSSLASTQLASKSPTTRLAHPQKPSPISATTSSGSTTTSSSLSDHSRTSTSVSSVSQSPVQPPPHHHQQHSHSQQPQHQHQHQLQQQHQHHAHHPNHPGPITLPPLRPPTFPMSPHHPSASGISLSPLHHPAMGSPYHMYPTAAAAAAYQQQVVPITPQGLPPITPSMPPFTFLPPQHLQHLQQQQQQHGQHGQQQPQTHPQAAAAASRRMSVAAQGGGGSAPPAMSSASSSASASVSASAEGSFQRGPHPSQQHQQQQQLPPQTPYASAHGQFMIPLPSPGLYGQQPQPSPPIMHPSLRLNLSTIPSSFSPGGTMSPGTFYGRQRDGLPMPNANPFINAAVGAPVHLHSPEGMPLPPGMVAHPAHPSHPGAPHPSHPGAHMQPAHMQTPYQSHGAYFYAASGVKKGPLTGLEPKGYFDPMYFPTTATAAAAGGGGVGGSSLANEILQDKDVGEASSSAAGATASNIAAATAEKEREREREKDRDSNTDSSDTAGGGDSGREGSGSGSPPRRSSKQSGDDSGPSTVMRTRSVGYTSKTTGEAAAAPPYTTTQSDPNIRVTHPRGSSGSGGVTAQGSPSALGEDGKEAPSSSSPPWSRRVKTTGQIPQVGEEGTTATTVTSTLSISSPEGMSGR